ncbi:Maf family protein [Sedimentibacter sp.]|uniref:Maf family protein n=1 Tax=Sedimentibacter sp. TaxID=1960295 RepID=UPI00289BE98A|nr:Maf family protein [Sedimentibacter sp.]
MKNIILASKSPRRIEMLERYCKDLKIFSPDTSEVINENDSPQTTVMKLAFEKCFDAYKYCDDKGIIIAADTIVYLNKIMGKPENEEDAYNMLKSLSGNTHSVYTGICIIDNENLIKAADYEKTSVEFNELSDDLIKSYLKTGEYADKAGGYGIQGYGELLVKRIDGCYNNVKGLPLTKLNNLLTKHFSHKLL